ncbi:homodimeric glycerol 3-phosphate dehydrogenase (quinone) [Paenibacillus cellulosilyticus]|uniref:Glycerol-3-phosphate dehydrogenase n=1 Tax=Paenibacillus cellulosilyticus TaxID=375489 RepID=A0A2V2Z0E5_9BACL|nr:glycerol-3-phosphate dehydrogenase/oxidase [Paenibacillus cellulosilyticus]PWW08753.1 homodimeric glycerol 3-phosphate dehydrogenase (quinone) [Paenibacillus cellulosilyticus]QKS48312.1 FAD-dependent oxidoreductase [Paenibacillus cellulosilyticus]
MNNNIVSDRRSRLSNLENEVFDVLIVGGGITGAGIALDTRKRGMSTVLIEMQDFAAGTSSRSTKLVHGGLRYLKQFEVKMVAEVGKERAVVYENGPHVTTPEWMLLPFYQGGTFGAFSTSIGLRVYDFLAGVKREERRKMLSKEETLAKEPLLRRDGLKGGGYYVEYRTDDARLTIEVMKKAVEAGAQVANYVKAEELLYEEGKLVGVVVRDVIGGGTYRIKARQIVNATGPWVDTLRELDRSKQGKTLRLTKGVHLVFDGGCFPLRQAIYFDTPDGRMVFAIPRDGKTYVGTTDTDYKGDTVHPRMSEEDRDYILAAANGMFPELKLTADDVESSWAGLRPLIYEEGKSPSEVSRRDEIFVSPSGLITIAGGKLTGYRKMAETVTDLLATKLGEAGRGTFKPCSTKTLPISGGDVGGSRQFPLYVNKMTDAGMKLGLSKESSEKLVRRYGSNVTVIHELIRNGKGSLQAPHLPNELRAELLYAIEEEMVVKPVDFLMRRTGAILFDMDWARRWKEAVIDFMADWLAYSDDQKREYTQEVELEMAAASKASEH